MCNWCFFATYPFACHGVSLYPFALSVFGFASHIFIFLPFLDTGELLHTPPLPGWDCFVVQGDCYWGDMI